MQNEEPKSEQSAPPSDNLRDVDSTRLLGDFRRVCELIGSIYFHGNFKAETANERELESLLRKLGYFFDNEEQLMNKLYPLDNGHCAPNPTGQARPATGGK